jgi:hypothetical protein
MVTSIALAGGVREGVRRVDLQRAAGDCRCGGTGPQAARKAASGRSSR